jgi:hypothetical protein
VDVKAAYVAASGKRIAALPLFDGSFTDADGISGRLGTDPLASEILLTGVNAAGISSEGRVLEPLRTSGPQRALIVITRGGYPGLIPMNAAVFTRPVGIPTLQVGSDDGPRLEQQAATGASVQVVANVARTATTAANIVARAEGANESLAPVIVITPRSGWWNCASERGGGIACWLEAMRAVTGRKPARTVIFLASSGHELGHLGLDAFIDRQPDLVKRAQAWIHLGANIGASGGSARMQAADDEIAKQMDDALNRAGATVATRVPRGTVPAGEARDIHVGGGRYVSLLGSGPRFADAIRSVVLELAAGKG